MRSPSYEVSGGALCPKLATDKPAPFNSPLRALVAYADTNFPFLDELASHATDKAYSKRKLVLIGNLLPTSFEKVAVAAAGAEHDYNNATETERAIGKALSAAGKSSSQYIFTANKVRARESRSDDLLKGVIYNH